MIKKDLLIFIILLGIVFFVSAQKNRDSYEIGHYIDIEENLIEERQFSIEPNICLVQY